MAEVTSKQIVEALLMASEEPLNLEKLHKILNSDNNEIEIKALRDIINDLVNDYTDCGIELKEVASGWRFQIKHDLSPWVSKLYEERPPRYSKALMEILALIAYRQPITRAEIESIRGVVVSSNIIKTLLEHEWIKIVGHKEVPGRPALFATTKKFLDHFNLKHLDELPSLMEFTENMLPNVESGVAVAEGEEILDEPQNEFEACSSDSIEPDEVLDDVEVTGNFDSSIEEEV